MVNVYIQSEKPATREERKKSTKKSHGVVGVLYRLSSPASGLSMLWAYGACITWFERKRGAHLLPPPLTVPQSPRGGAAFKHHCCVSCAVRYRVPPFRVSLYVFMHASTGVQFQHTKISLSQQEVARFKVIHIPSVAVHL